MGDLQVGEAFKDKVYLIETATGNPHLLQTPTVVVIDESGNRAVAANATEESDGWYYYSFTPDAAGTWSLEWANAGSTFINNYIHYFKVGGGEVTDIKTETASILAATDAATSSRAAAATALSTATWTAARAGYIDELAAANLPTDVAAVDMKVTTIDGFHDVPAADAAANVVIRDVVGNKTDTVAGTSLVGLAKAIKAKTDALPTDPADDSDIDAAIAVIDGFHDVPVADVATDAQIRDVVGRKTDTANTTVGATSSLMRYLKGAINELAGVRARTDRHLITRAWFSPSQEEVALTAAAGDKTLPSVTLPNITGTIAAIYAGFKFRMIENTNAAINELSGAQEIQINKAGGAWTDAINFVDTQFEVAATTREGGDCIIGIIELATTLTAVFNAVYNFQWDEGVADLANLQFNDVQTFLIVSYY